MEDPDRVLVAGDTHGDEHWCRRLVEIAVAEGCQVILQLGDFGYWPEGDAFLDQVEEACLAAGLEVWWIGGNHEHHERLRQLQPGPDGLVTVRPHLRHIPHGHRWTWHGVRFGALGGAFSIDRRWRTLNVDWFREEEPTEADLVRLGTDPLDVLVTHDAPEGAVDDLAGQNPLVRPSDEAASRRTRLLLRAAVDVTRPRLVVHGHWHVRRRATINYHDGRGTTVEGLASNMEGSTQAWGVLELPTLSFRSGPLVEED